LKPVKGNFEIKAMTLDGKVLVDNTIELAAKANTSAEVYEIVMQTNELIMEIYCYFCIDF
jgi:hypothetical protein